MQSVDRNLMKHFCLLSDIDKYVAHDWDMLNAPDQQGYWLDLFATHFDATLTHATRRYGRGSAKQRAAAAETFSKALDELRENPASLPGGKLNVLELCRLRDNTLRAHGLHDPFSHIKDRENAAAEKTYRRVVHDLHGADHNGKWLGLITRVFAGNVFDLGSLITMNMTEQSADFLTTLENVRPRPWLVDDCDRLIEDLAEGPPPKWFKAVLFVDNAGGDFVLGIMPLVRELAMAGTQVVLAANELPSLNDITAEECIDVIERLAATDDDLSALIQGGMLEVVSTGNDIPLIDLAQVSDELNEAAADADLVILEGMGRAVESNFDAEFKVDCVRLALLKDPKVAEHIGGEVYDCVCKYTPVEA